MGDEQPNILNAGSLNKIASNPDNTNGNGKFLMIPGQMSFSSGKLHITLNTFFFSLNFIPFLHEIKFIHKERHALDRIYLCTEHMNGLC